MSCLQYARLVVTYDGDLVPFHFDFWSPEVLERDDPGETGAVDHVPRVRQHVDRQTDVPYLPYAEYIMYDFG